MLQIFAFVIDQQLNYTGPQPGGRIQLRSSGPLQVSQPAGMGLTDKGSQKPGYLYSLVMSELFDFHLQVLWQQFSQKNGPIEKSAGRIRRPQLCAGSRAPFNHS